MAYKDIKPGKYKAKATRGGIGKSKNKGTLQVGIEFEFMTTGGELETLWWMGYLTDAAKERVYNTLALLDFKENYVETPGENGTMFADDALDKNKEVEIVVEMEEYEGKSRPKISWVNALGGSRFSGLPSIELKSTLSSINFSNELAAARASMGLPAKPALTKPTQEKKLSHDGLPF